MPGLHRRSQDQALPEPALADPSLSDSGGWLRWRAAARTADPIECREVLGVGIGEVWRYLWVVVIWAWSIRPALSLSLSHVGGREHLPVEWIQARLVNRRGTASDRANDPVPACAVLRERQAAADVVDWTARRAFWAGVLGLMVRERTASRLRRA